MKVLIVGGGGREHAIAWKIAQGGRANEIQMAPGNGGTDGVGPILNVTVPIKPPFDDLIAHCTNRRIDLVIVGPEASLVAGLADALAAAKIPCFGPTKEAAQLEGSKAFTRELTQEACVPSYEFGIFDSADAAQDFYRGKSEPWWIKADGLAAGKGAVLPTTIEEGCQLLHEWLAEGKGGEAGSKVVIEEPLVGTEASVIAIAAGETVRCFAPSQDHKRLLDGDQGPNTGGMGVFGPTPHMTPELLAEVERDFLLPTLRGLANRGIPFCGFMYAGIMITAQGPRLLEYNIRLGDPEAQVILPLMDNDLLEVIEATLAGRLDEVAIQQRPGAAVTVVGAAEGYPASPRKGDVIEGLQAAEAALGDQGVIFHAGTRSEGGKILTNGGRVLAVTGFGDDLASARDRAYEGIGLIHWPGMQYRRDIAQRF